MNKVIRTGLAVLSLMGLVACNEPDPMTQGDKDEVNDLIVSSELSNSRVKCITEDAKGFLWIGTFRGLNRYDGKEYHQYFCAYDSMGLPDNNIQYLLCDSRKRLWVGTVNGIGLYNEYDSFERISLQSRNRNILGIFEDSKGNIYANTTNKVFIYNEDKSEFDTFLERELRRDAMWCRCYIAPNDEIYMVEIRNISVYTNDSDTALFHNTIPMRIPVEDSYFTEMLPNGILAVAGTGSLFMYDTGARRPVRMRPPNRQRLLENGNTILSMCLLENNLILISTEKNGVFLYDFISDRLVAQGEDEFTYNIPDSYITCIYEDSRRNIWCGTYDQGLVADYYYKEIFNSDYNVNRLTGNASVLALAVDRGSNLWISTLLKGLFVYHTWSGRAESVELKGLEGADENAAITHMYADNEGYLWLSTAMSVIKTRYDGQSLNVECTYRVPRPMDFEMKDGTLWISTSTTNIYSIEHNATTAVPKQIFNVDFTFIPKILNLSDGRMLIAALNQKIVAMDHATGRLRELNITDMDKCIRRSMFIPTDMYQDTKGDVWIGTVSNGVLRYNIEENRMERISGLSCSDVGSIIEDFNGNIWISTMKGLNRYDRNSGRISSYYKVDGLSGDEFYDRAACRLPNGKLVFGGIDGVTMFDPSEVVAERNLPLFLGDLHVHNRLIRPEKNAPLEKMLDMSDVIRLNHKDNSFSLSFSALDFGEHERVRYYYKMDGFDSQWIDAGTSHSAYYANLPAGKYRFRVRITGSDNAQAGHERSIRVIVRPAKLNSWWAWLIYLSIISYYILVIYRNASRVVEARRQARNAELEKEHEQRTNRMNMSFFANIAHEFRTPLTMIAGPVKQLVTSKNLRDEDRKLLSITNRNVQRMFKLVNQLMDFNKLENDTLNLNVAQIDVVKLLNEICDTFEFNAREKGLTLNRFGLEESLMAWTDADKVEKIVYNLLSNALKFTPAGGSVDVSLDVNNSNVSISIADTGKGIPDEQKENIFKRYYQLDNQTKEFVNWGTGIGLYFARRLAELHHGELNVNNRPEGHGAVFTLTYPMDKESYTDEERSMLVKQDPEVIIAEPAAGEIPQETQGKDGRPSILVVDDDTEIINYMRVLFSREYRLTTCLDADSALQSLRKEEPNIVLSDVAMPGKDGYELCREIKQDMQLSHIPVILVTAKVTPENQVEGLNVGADAYVTKPFEPSVLQALIQSQLKNRERLRNVLGKSTTTTQVEEAEEVLSEYDKKFMDELYKLMEEELSNTELNINRITDLLYMSRTKLYYKIKGLTGETPSSFFRTYKLNRAAELLKSGKYTVSEIVDKTGFSTQSHFSSVFKSKFGVSPSQYK